MSCRSATAGVSSGGPKKSAPDERVPDCRRAVSNVGVCSAVELSSDGHRRPGCRHPRRRSRRRRAAEVGTRNRTGCPAWRHPHVHAARNARRPRGTPDRCADGGGGLTAAGGRHFPHRRRVRSREPERHRRDHRSGSGGGAGCRRARWPRRASPLCCHHDADGPRARREAAAARLRRAARRTDHARCGAVRRDVGGDSAAAARGSIRSRPRHSSSRAVDARAALLGDELRGVHRATHDGRRGLSADRPAWRAGVFNQRDVDLCASEQDRIRNRTVRWRLAPWRRARSCF